MESITSLTLKKNVDMDALSFVWKEPFLSEHKAFYKTAISWTSLVVQWLRLFTSKEGDTGSIPGLGNEIPFAMWPNIQTQ